MNDEDSFQLIAFRDERLARHAVSAQPAWLWSADGLRILWSNPVAASIFGARNSVELSGIDRSPADAAGRQVAKLGRSLAANGTVRLEKLAGFGAPLGGLATCACTRLRFDNHDAILIVGMDRPLHAPPLDERLKRLIDGLAIPLAIFSRDGRLVATTTSASELAAGAKTLADFDGGQQTIETTSLGSGGDVALVAFLQPGKVVVKNPRDDGTTAHDSPSQHLPADQHPIDRTEPDSLAEQFPCEENFVDDAEAIEPLLTASERFDIIGDDSLLDDVFDETEVDDWPEPAPSTSVQNQPAETATNRDTTDTMSKPEARDPNLTPQTPLRFVWQTDAQNRFTLDEGEFGSLLAQQVSRRLGDTWSDLDAAFNLDPTARISQALNSRETWTGLISTWPACRSDLRIVAEMSGIPVYDHDRAFAGFRGFGICRDHGVLDQLFVLHAQAKDSRDPEFNSEPSLVSEVSMDDTMDSKPPTPNVPEIGPLVAEPAPGALSDESHANVVPFRPLAEQRPPVLTPVENSAFNEIARQLSARLEGKAANDEPLLSAASPAEPDASPDETEAADEAEAATPDLPIESQGGYQHPAPAARPSVPRTSTLQEKTLLERFPFGILVYRLDRLLFANRAFLERTGFASLHDLSEAGGLDALYVEPGVPSNNSTSESGTILKVAATQADPTPSDARLMTVSWDDEPALALVLLPPSGTQPADTSTTAEPVVPKPIAAKPADQPPAPSQESELPSEFAQAKREATRTATARADLLARISHDIRAPLLTITGFADVMIEQRFGPLGNERYVEYMKDIRASGERILAIVNDMLDLSQIESGRVALAFTANNLNHVIEQCVAAMQPQANRERVIIRSSLAKGLPPVMADARTLRQIATTLIAGAVRMSRTGAQIIVSTALDDGGAVALRLRDASHVMTENDISTVMDPLGSGPREESDGAAFNLSVTRALVTANRAKLNIRSAAQTGTLIEVIFPTNDTRMSHAN